MLFESVVRLFLCVELSFTEAISTLNNLIVNIEGSLFEGKIRLFKYPSLSFFSTMSMQWCCENGYAEKSDNNRSISRGSSRNEVKLTHENIRPCYSYLSSKVTKRQRNEWESL